MNSSIREFYDKFSNTFIRDMLNGNLRIDRINDLLKNVITPDAASMLIIGCGAGQQAHYIATRIAKKANILAVDISTENLIIAGKLNKHPNIEYRQVDITNDYIEGNWDYILLPDVYEHIPKDKHAILHDKIKTFSSDKCRIVFTVPSPYHQALLREKGEELQIVDEDILLDDLVCAAKDIEGVLVYFQMVSVWRQNDYIYAVIEKDAGKANDITSEHQMPYKGYGMNLKRNIFMKVFHSVIRKLKITAIYRKIIKRRIIKRLS